MYWGVSREGRENVKAEKNTKNYDVTHPYISRDILCIGAYLFRETSYNTRILILMSTD